MPAILAWMGWLIDQQADRQRVVDRQADRPLVDTRKTGWPTAAGMRQPGRRASGGGQAGVVGQGEESHRRAGGWI